MQAILNGHSRLYLYSCSSVCVCDCVCVTTIIKAREAINLIGSEGYARGWNEGTWERGIRERQERRE